jgi:multidrug resistance efflux pump
MGGKNLLLVVLLIAAAAGSLALGKHWFGPDPGAEPSRAESRVDGRSHAGLTWFGYVDLRHGTAELNPLRPGRIAKVLVRENDEVSRGAPLVQLDDEVPRLQAEEAASALKAAQANLARAQRLPAEFLAKTAQQQDAIQAAEHRLEAARQSLDHKRNLQAKSLISSQELAVAESQTKEMEAICRLEKGKLVELKERDPGLDITIAKEETDRLQTKLALAKRELDEYTLKAPQRGTVMQILVREGESLAPSRSQPALLFAPKEPRIIRAEIEQEFASKFKLGTRVRVEDDANVEALGEGVITYLSDWFLPRRHYLQDPTAYNSGRTVECIVTLDPGHAPLRIGQRVRLRLLQ